MKLKVGILGATGAVGQKFVSLLEGHPWFEISAVAASERSSGRTYEQAVHWLEERPLPSKVGALVVSNAHDELLDCDFVFSGLDSSVAGEIEEKYARSGYPVISNARNFRMDPTVPLLIPEVNPDHLALIEHQPWYDGGGFIVTNPNCATVGLTMALKPLQDAFGIHSVHVTTLQALSGAGYPGVASLDAMANVVPFIDGEETKVESEPLKLLGSLNGNRVEPASFGVSAQCTRVPVVDGHTATVSVRFETSGVSLESAIRELASFHPPKETSGLPTSPGRVFEIFDDPSAPQPRRHVGLGNGMTVSIGRLRPCPLMDLKFVCLVHNTVRGAAGGAILNAELLASKGLLAHRTPKQGDK